jgi:hypothetical protein
MTRSIGGVVRRRSDDLDEPDSPFDFQQLILASQLSTAPGLPPPGRDIAVRREDEPLQTDIRQTRHIQAFIAANADSAMSSRRDRSNGVEVRADLRVGQSSSRPRSRSAEARPFHCPSAPFA